MKTLWMIVIAGSLLAPASAFAKCKDKELGNLKKADAATLVKGLTNKDEGCREDSAKILGDKIGDGDINTEEAKASFGPLQEMMLTDSSYSVRMDGLRAVEEYLSNANLKGDALTAIQAAFERDDQEPEFFAKALALLMANDPTRAEQGVIVHLSRYRKYPGPFIRKLLDASQKLNNPEARDLPLLIVLDVGQPKPVRVKALDTLEALEHPGLIDAYLAMLDDPDKKIQLRCIDGLSRSGLPPHKVQAALSKVVKNDDKGDVRARALKGLKLYASPELLPLIHSEVASEKHIFAWYHAMEMLLLLADQSSFPILNQVLTRAWAYNDEMVIQTFQTLLRLTITAPPEQFGVMADQVISSIGVRINIPEGELGAVSEATRAEGQRIIDLLSPKEPETIVQLVGTWALPVFEVTVLDLSVVDESSYSYEMSVQVDAGGHVVTSSGAALGFGGVSASVKVSD